MKIEFILGWIKNNKNIARGYKSAECWNLFSEYQKRISFFSECAVSGQPIEQFEHSKTSTLWICERSKGSKLLSSEEIAKNLLRVVESGKRELQIVIGGSDGVNSKELTRLKPDLLWSFGALTLPHELASVVAAEQIYRAWAIIKNHPYHSGH